MRIKKQMKNTYWHVIIGVIQAVIISALTAALGAVFVDNETIVIESIPVITFIAWLLSSFMCAVFAGLSGEGKWAARSVIATGIYYVILMCVGAFVFDGLSGSLGYGLFAVAMGYALGIFVLVKKQKKHTKKRFRNFRAS